MSNVVTSANRRSAQKAEDSQNHKHGHWQSMSSNITLKNASKERVPKRRKKVKSLVFYQTGGGESRRVLKNQTSILGSEKGKKWSKMA